MASLSGHTLRQALEALQAAVAAARRGDRALAQATLDDSLLQQPLARDETVSEGKASTGAQVGASGHQCAAGLQGAAGQQGALAQHYYWRALLAFSLGQWAQASADAQRACSISPNTAQIYALHAEILKAQGKAEAACEAYQLALAREPRHANWRFNLALCFEAAQALSQALEAYREVFRLAPKHEAALNHYALLLQRIGEHAQAEAIWTQALAHNPQFEAARLNRALLWLGAGRHGAAQAELEAVHFQNPAQVQALLGLGAVHTAAKAPQAAMHRYEQAFALAPHEPFLLGQLMMAKLQLAHWQEIDQLFAHLNEGLAAGLPLCTPFSALALTDAPHWQLQVAQAFEQRTVSLESPKAIAQVNPHTNPQATQALALRWAPGERVKLAYFSADMHEHATAYLIAELFEQHDRSQFEVFVFSYGKKSDDAAQRRLKAAVEHWVEVSEQSDAAIVQAARAAGIHIAVDLKGYTLGGRPKLFAHRLAPIQVSYLGFPGSLGAPYMDYLIADRILIATEIAQSHYREAVVRLPYSYQVNDSAWSQQAHDKAQQAHGTAQQAHGTERPGVDLPGEDSPDGINTRAVARSREGLDAKGVVFCCFNNTYKISPAVFGQWMTILRAVPESQLWLLEDNAPASQALRAHAQAAGIAPARLVFAARCERKAHLARLALADLFLDTFPYNAHTTASDALRAGVPLLTRCGQSFASRVGASLLSALGLAPLITHEPQAYEALAIALGQDPVRLLALRHDLSQALARTTLFKADGVRPWLECAYRFMLQRAASGLEPAGFDVHPGTDVHLSTERAYCEVR